MIRVLAETMTGLCNGSLKCEVLEFVDLQAFKAFVMRHFPKINTTMPEKYPNEYSFGIRCGSTADGFWFRWLHAIMENHDKCLYSTGNEVCQERMGLPEGRRHCSASARKLLEEIEAEVKAKKNSIIFVE